MTDYLFNFDKLAYVTGNKPRVGCILCAIRDRDSRVTMLDAYRGEGMIVSLNLYPFNPGHLMIFPERHVAEYGDLQDGEALAMHRLTARAIAILREEFNPTGFNVGYNIGENSGASIPHLHQHVVPRYGNEVGFLDVLAGARVWVADPQETLRRLRDRFSGA